MAIQQSKVAVPPRRTKRPRVEFEQWPASDRAAWEMARKPSGFLSPGGKGATWRPASSDSLVGNYGRWLGFLQSRGWLFDSEAPADRVTQPRILALIDMLQQDYAPVTATVAVSQLLMALNAMCPASDWAWLRNARANLQREALPLRHKSERVQESREIVDLGHQLMQQAEALTMTDPERAANLYRDGFMIALLAMRPFRRRNFLSIEIGRHLLRSGSSWSFSFAAEETKNGRVIAREFPSELLPCLTRYLERHRPCLRRSTKGGSSTDRASAVNRLWISSRGNPMSLTAFARSIAHHTERHFGRAMHPHAFRHSAATSMARVDPAHAYVAMDVLDHADIATTQRHYIAAKGERSHEHVEALIEERREAVRGLLSPARKGKAL
ncbi:hypothetical protein EOD42_25485 [Rhodovarius crocodyli]|uniref:Tyr recombinase domain-containing protein n=1 Tax=Rhodovarius crocodyli TaxID=1979269 RepID=A0A437LV38_9PROT|nr:tyrosine-type recombinase/integrase [Rhodovarius crocodyli]RVT89280.1 hypothetical protein EOD42_25485 [Rhodovarius crocodyli]